MINYILYSAIGLEILFLVITLVRFILCLKDLDNNMDKIYKAERDFLMNSLFIACICVFILVLRP